MPARAAAMLPAILLSVAFAAAAQDKAPAPTPGNNPNAAAGDALAVPCARDPNRSYGKAGQEITGTRVQDCAAAAKPQTRGATGGQPASVTPPPSPTDQTKSGDKPKSGDPKAADKAKSDSASSSWPADKKSTKKSAKAADTKSATASGKNAATGDAAKTDDGLGKPPARTVPTTSSQNMTGTRGIHPPPPAAPPKQDDKAPK